VGGRSIIVGVLNVTPDSFSDGGNFIDAGRAVEHALMLVEQGADIIDVGGESSRPGAQPVGERVELDRVGPVIEGLAKKSGVPISIDTYKPGVARAAVELGAGIVNDITGFKDSGMVDVVAQSGAAACVMHMRGRPQVMQDNPVYEDVIGDIMGFLGGRVRVLRDAGVKDIIVDPGIGFGKTLGHNLLIVKRLREFSALGCPVMVGPSRKSFIGGVSGVDVADRLEGTIAACVVSRMNGAGFFRVHDVLNVRRALDIADAVIGCDG
jgi:dihydropteroate synthase